MFESLKLIWRAAGHSKAAEPDADLPVVDWQALERQVVDIEPLQVEIANQLALALKKGAKLF